MSDIYQKLNKIQTELKAPKGQFNDFGKYKYRSCEDIVESLKPLLAEHGLVILLSDEIVNIGSRFYVKATVTLTDGEANIFNTAYAREDEMKKGMDGSQVTGASSSYARKYALNGLLAIDDTRDADATNTHDKDDKPTKKPEPKEEKIAPETVKNITELITVSDSDANALLKYYGVKDLSEMTRTQGEDCKRKLNTKLDKMENEKEEYQQLDDVPLQ